MFIGIFKKLIRRAFYGFFILNKTYKQDNGESEDCLTSPVEQPPPYHVTGVSIGSSFWIRQADRSDLTADIDRSVQV